MKDKKVDKIVESFSHAARCVSVIHKLGQALEKGYTVALHVNEGDDVLSMLEKVLS